MNTTGASMTVSVSLSLEITHASPQGKGGRTPCCNHTVFELKRTDRLTNDMALVTCPGAWLRVVAEHRPYAKDCSEARYKAWYEDDDSIAEWPGRDPDESRADYIVRNDVTKLLGIAK